MGCTAVEADIWPSTFPASTNTSTILVGHSSSSLISSRSLKTLYLDPLLTILQNINNDSNPGATWKGVYENSPNTSLVLMLDFKSLEPGFWDLVVEQLEPLRRGGWLTYWTNGTLTKGAVTVVASGRATLDKVAANSTYRDIFLDAPLMDITNPLYNTSNSYYASVSTPHHFNPHL
jgi:hypothetical protein